MTFWLLILLAVPASFLFSGIETALLSVSRVRILHRAKEGDRRDSRLAALYAERENLITSVLILNNAVTIVVFATVTLALVDAAGAWGYAASFALFLPVYLVFGELLPKSICKRAPYRFLRGAFPALWVVSLSLLPLVRVVRRGLALVRDGDAGLARSTSPLTYVGDPGSEEAREEFKTLAAMMETQGTLGTTELRMIESVVDFQHIKARDVMIPLDRVTAVLIDMPVATVLDLASQTGIDQFPAMSRSGNLVGLINIFEVLRAAPPGVTPPAHPGGGTAVNYLRKLVRTGPDEPALAIVRRLRRSGSEVAGVFGENGRPLGIVSSEDLVACMVVRK